MAQDEGPAEGAKPTSEAGPAAASGPAGAGPAREASSRPLEASAGVPEHGERERWEESAPPPAGGASAPPPAPAEEPAVKIIEAPEAKPVSEMQPALTPSEVKPVLPDEKGVVIFEETAKIDWGEGRMPGEAAPMAGAPAGPPVPAPAAPAEGAGVGWGLTEAGAPAEERPGAPAHPPLPRPFWGTGVDIRRFIRNGTFMFFAGSAVYFVLAAYCLGVAFLNAFDGWAYRKAADFAIAGLLALCLSAGAFACLLLSRSRLEEPLRRNDVAAVRRRLPVAVGAGLVFGLVLGGLLLYLAHVKVGELPFSATDGRAGEPGPQKTGPGPVF